MKHFGILGGGIAGLSLSYFLGENNDVLEGDSITGGLCRTFEKEGFTFDLGGHIIFSKDKEILDFELSLLKDNINQLYRKTSCWFKGRLVKYPFENGLSVLDKDDIYDCLYNYLTIKPRPQNNFEDWMYNSFGSGIAEKYLIPYNEKIWKTAPRDMDVQWVERVPKPPMEDIVKSAVGVETEGYTHQLHFYYPSRGGFESLPKAFETQIESRITRQFRVNSIRSAGNNWVVSNGKEQREYEKLICAMPIFDFVETLENVPQEVLSALRQLRYNSLIVVMVGIDQPRKLDQASIYFPQPDLLFHRILFFDYLGKYVPDGCSSIVAEITAREGDATWSMSDEQVAAEVVDGLAREGFLTKNHVVTTSVKRTKYAYVIYDLTRKKNLDIVHSYCKGLGIEFCGRFAEFEYYNSDAVIRSAKNLSEKMLSQN